MAVDREYIVRTLRESRRVQGLPPHLDPAIVEVIGALIARKPDERAA